MELEGLLQLLADNGGSWMSSVVVGIVALLFAYNLIRQAMDNKKQIEDLNDIIESLKIMRAEDQKAYTALHAQLRQAQDDIRDLQVELRRCYGKEISE